MLPSCRLCNPANGFLTHFSSSTNGMIYQTSYIKTAALILLGINLCLPGSTEAAERISPEWNQLRGPNGQGHPTHPVEVPLTWNETEHIVWKTPVPGLGWSSPVLEGKIWLTSTRRGSVLKAYSFDLSTGKRFRK
ncbi:MAG: hypothetical protein R3C11_02045 [Planctomycetaceae bacterium]